MQDVKEDGSGRVLFISPLKLSDHVWLLRKIWGNGGKLVEVASPKWGAFPSRVCFEKMFTPKTRYRWTNKNWGNMILIVAKASIHKLLLCFSQFAVCWKPATLFFRSFFFWGGRHLEHPWTRIPRDVTTRWITRKLWVGEPPRCHHSCIPCFPTMLMPVTQQDSQQHFLRFRLQESLIKTCICDCYLMDRGGGDTKHTIIFVKPKKHRLNST